MDSRILTRFNFSDPNANEDTFQRIGKFCSTPAIAAFGKSVKVISLKSGSQEFKEQLPKISRIFWAFIAIALLPLTLIGLLCTKFSKTHQIHFDNYKKPIVTTVSTPKPTITEEPAEFPKEEKKSPVIDEKPFPVLTIDVNSPPMSRTRKLSVAPTPVIMTPPPQQEKPQINVIPRPVSPVTVLPVIVKTVSPKTVFSFETSTSTSIATTEPATVLTPVFVPVDQPEGTLPPSINLPVPAEPPSPSIIRPEPSLYQTLFNGGVAPLLIPVDQPEPTTSTTDTAEILRDLQEIKNNWNVNTFDKKTLKNISKDEQTRLGHIDAYLLRNKKLLEQINNFNAKVFAFVKSKETMETPDDLIQTFSLEDVPLVKVAYKLKQDVFYDAITLEEASERDFEVKISEKDIEQEKRVFIKFDQDLKMYLPQDYKMVRVFIKEKANATVEKLLDVVGKGFNEPICTLKKFNVVKDGFSKISFTVGEKGYLLHPKTELKHKKSLKLTERGNAGEIGLEEVLSSPFSFSSKKYTTNHETEDFSVVVNFNHDKNFQALVDYFKREFEHISFDSDKIFRLALFVAGLSSSGKAIDKKRIYLGDLVCSNNWKKDFSALLIKALADQLGIKCGFVATDDLIGRGEDKHPWNILSIGGEYWILDPVYMMFFPILEPPGSSKGTIGHTKRDITSMYGLGKLMRTSAANTPHK